MVVPVWLEGVMAVLLWVCSLALMSLMLAAWREGREAAPDRWWSYPVVPALAGVPVEPGPPARHSPRPTLQTGVAILAVALAIDVSAAPLAQLAPVEPGPAVSAGFHDLPIAPEPMTAYGAASWTLAATATDGWFV